MKSSGQPTASRQTGKSGKGTQRAVLGEQGGKQLLESDRSDVLIMEFSANGSVPDDDPAILRNEISSYLFEYLDGFHIPTHFVGKLSEREMLIRRAELLPLEVWVINVGNADLVTRYQIPEGKVLEFPIIEHYYRNARGERVLANENHLFALEVVTPEEFKQINRIASKANAVLRGLTERRNLALCEMRLLFGKCHGQLMLIDELSPVTCRFSPIDKGGNGSSASESMKELRDRLMLKA